MALPAGSRLGPYEILSPLGAGGMGEVYRARDARLGRDVALKVLPEVFSKDAERMARFEREAQVLASLNHPNIASLYGLEESDGVRALVMELVEGPTLGERIATRPDGHPGAAAMSLDEALPIAKQIAEALEAAHERGIIHRDLKPANIKLTRDGAVKVLDFGLAKALDDDPVSGSVPNSPTMSLAATRAGVILGTAGYMSPEQAKGKPADKRADIWSFGLVLYEMLTGKQMYSGETAAETLAAVLMKDPTLDALPANTPAAIRKLLRRCLDKDPKRRLRDIGEARIAIEEALSGAVSGPAGPSAATSPQLPSRPLAWIAAAAALLLALAAVSLVHLREKPPVTELMRFQLQPPEHGRFGVAFALSPDGRQLAFPATGPNGQSSLWVRSLDSLEPRLLPGTEGAFLLPFWSPDSRFLVFAAGGKLKKIEAAGGPPQALCDAPAVVIGGSWNPNGVILFSSNFGVILKVSAAGGIAAPVTALAPEETYHSHPFFLPDGRHFLYTRLAQRAENTGIYVGSVDAKPEDQRAKRVLNAGYAIYAASADPARGYLLFLRERTLMAQPFDPAKLELAGDPVPVADPVGQYANRGLFSASANGALAYRSGVGGVNRLTWFDRQGKVLGYASDLGAYNTLALAPDATRVAAQRTELQTANFDIWLIDLLRGGSTRFTFDPAFESNPVWSPDGRRIVFASNRDGVYNLYEKDSSGAGAEEPLFKSNGNKYPHDWSRDGRFLIYAEVSPKTGYDLWVLPMTGERKPTPFLQTQFREDQAQFSPDGHWVAYLSDASGAPEIYVRPFPASQSNGGQWMISNGGGTQPRWRGDGKELLYFSGRKLMAVDISTNPAFKAGIPKVLFEAPLFAGTTLSLHHWDAAADGKRFLINTEAGENNPAPITVVLNWAAGLKR